jgi:hypothetical protein
MLVGEVVAGVRNGADFSAGSDDVKPVSPELKPSTTWGVFATAPRTVAVPARA